MKEIEELIEISRKYGKDSRYVIAGGGNTSYKNAEKLWVKASGCALATITEDGFAVLDRKKLNVISEKTYSSDTAAREEEVKNDLAAACITKDRRPSVETSMHNALEANFIVHLHPTMVNGLMCGQNAEAETQKLFGDDAVYIPYTDPGYVLFKEVENRINAYKAKSCCCRTTASSSERIRPKRWKPSTKKCSERSKRRPARNCPKEMFRYANALRKCCPPSG